MMGSGNASGVQEKSQMNAFSYQKNIQIVKMTIKKIDCSTRSRLLVILCNINIHRDVHYFPVILVRKIFEFHYNYSSSYSSLQKSILLFATAFKWPHGQIINHLVDR